jgi:phage terminase large subunit-like protein
MLLIDDEKFPRWNLSKMENTYRVSEEIINDLPPDVVSDILKGVGSERDMDILFDNILESTYSSLYGKHQLKDYGSTNLDYFNHLSDSIEETMRCEDFGYFVSSVLKDSFDIAWFHLEWFDIVQKHNYSLVEAARGHGKSWMFSNALPAWYMYRFKPKDNTPKEQSKRKIMQFSFSIAQAIDLLAILRETIETNDILKDRLYNPNSFSKMELVGKNKTQIKVKGFGGSVRGAHPYYIIVDDGLKDNVMYSSEAREKSINYFHSVIMNLLEPGGKITVVGTPFFETDLYGDLKKKKNWHCFEYPAIFPDGRILWPDRWSYEALMEKKISQGSLIFSRELLCKPILSSSTIFPIEILNNAFLRMEDFTLVNSRDNYKMKFDNIVVGCDFAISSAIGADSSCFTVFGIHENRFYLMYAYHEKGKTYAEQVAQINWINRQFKPTLIYLEDNAFQRIFLEGTASKGIPAKGFTTTAKKNDLRSGWSGLSILFETGRIKIPIGDERSKNIADIIVDQFSGVAFTDKGLVNTKQHDDFCSSFWLAWNAAKHLEGNTFDFTFV